MDRIPMPNAVDIVAMIVIAVGILQGLRRGLSGELARLISVVAAFILGLYGYRAFGLWIEDHTRVSGPLSAQALAFFLTVVTCFFAMVFLRMVLKRMMKVVFEQELDRLGGCVAGFVRSSLFVIIVIIIMNLWPHEYLNRKFGQESVIGRAIVTWCVPELKRDGAAGSGIPSASGALETL